MSLIRVIQESGIKNGSIYSLKVHDYEIENLKQIIKEKDVIIDNNNEKISELECHLLELKEQCTNSKSLKEESPKVKTTTTIKGLTTELASIMKNYEQFIFEMTTDYEVMKQERNSSSSHLAILEYCFSDLIKKYENLKVVVAGYQQNQETLLDQNETYITAIKVLQSKHAEFKKYATDKLHEANLFIKKNEKNYISELAKAKSQVLQSKVKITDLQNAIDNISRNESAGELKEDKKNILFDPLPALFKTS